MDLNNNIQKKECWQKLDIHCTSKQQTLDVLSVVSNMYDMMWASSKNVTTNDYNVQFAESNVSFESCYGMQLRIRQGWRKTGIRYKAS